MPAMETNVAKVTNSNFLKFTFHVKFERYSVLPRPSKTLSNNSITLNVDVFNLKNVHVEVNAIFFYFLQNNHVFLFKLQ